MHKNVFKNMHSKLIATGSEYVETGVCRVYGKFGFYKVIYKSYVNGFYKILNFMMNTTYLFLGKNFLSKSMWRKLFKKGVICSIEYETHGFIYGEDIIFGVQIFPHIKKIFILDEIGYGYRYGGMSSNYNPRIFDDLKNNIK